MTLNLYNPLFTEDTVNKLINRGVLQHSYRDHTHGYFHITILHNTTIKRYLTQGVLIY